ncbi:aldehyde dehydrogenase [Paracandidimonas lactea]|uniref:aldehyde dehydrogenase n=1 Tax=Paracandidimonas lactea TaxID=2895524 RepID=UPI001F29CD2E|nr:aldehyde dehydrogenase [Paracandidimonas lactea]
MMHKLSIPEIVTSYIQGGWEPAGSTRLPVLNPATEETIAWVSEADEAQTARAVEAAHASYRAGVWSRMPVAQRRAVFRRIAELTAQHFDELAGLEVINTGLPFAYARNRQIPRIVRNFEFFADWMSQNTERSGIQDDAYLRYVVRVPAGVAALISPWNAPLALASTKIAAALAFGNSCVVKTAEQTPLAVARFMELLTEAGVPPGVVNMVNGRGDVTGDALVRHPLVNVVSFTGGTHTGRMIAAAASPQLKRVDLELGGKSANIITASADLDAALDGALSAIYTNNGQQCFAGSRILVQREIADAFIGAFVERARSIRVGSPDDPDTELGPLANAQHYARVMSFVETAKAEGARILTGGQRPAHCPKGYYIEPTAVLVDSNQSRLCQEEIFGPFAAIQIFDTFDEAIRIANDSAFGLVSYLWSSDLEQCMRAGNEIEAGVVLVNTPMLLDLRFPFGGFKDSGLGREGIEGMRHFYTEEKTVTIALRRPDMVRFGA